MKKLLTLLALTTLILSMSPAKKNRVVFFGDSITQAGVQKGGYIDLVQETLKTKSLADKYDIIGAGIGGNKVYDLYLRMDDDVMSKKPNTVVIYVGINDVWHKSSSGTGTDIDKYEKFYIAIIKKLQAEKITVLVCTPSVIGEKKDGANPQDADLDAYSAVIRKLATTYNCTLIDLRKNFNEYEKANNADNKESGVLTSDRVHLNPAGNKFVSEAMLKGLGIN